MRRRESSKPPRNCGDLSLPEFMPALDVFQGESRCSQSRHFLWRLKKLPSSLSSFGGELPTGGSLGGCEKSIGVGGCAAPPDGTIGLAIGRTIGAGEEGAGVVGAAD